MEPTPTNYQGNIDCSSNAQSLAPGVQAPKENLGFYLDVILCKVRFLHIYVGLMGLNFDVIGAKFGSYIMVVGSNYDSTSRGALV